MRLKTLPPRKGSIHLFVHGGKLYADCDYTREDWPGDHPERWVGDRRIATPAWVKEVTGVDVDEMGKEVTGVDVDETGKEVKP